MTLEELGLNARLLIAGFAGGSVHAFLIKQKDPVVVVGSLISGAFTANYIGPTVAAIPHVGDWLGIGGAGFAVGVCWMTICQALVVAVPYFFDRLLGPRIGEGESK